MPATTDAPTDTKMEPLSDVELAHLERWNRERDGFTDHQPVARALAEIRRHRSSQQGGDLERARTLLMRDDCPLVTPARSIAYGAEYLAREFAAVRERANRDAEQVARNYPVYRREMLRPSQEAADAANEIADAIAVLRAAGKEG